MAISRRWAALVAAALLGSGAQAQQASFKVTVVPPEHGKLQLSPQPAADGRYPAGTIVTLTTRPDRGYVLDSAWWGAPGRFGLMYHEGMGREFKVTMDRDKQVGASFIEAAMVKNLAVTHDVVFAKPGVKALKYDVYAPKGAHGLPVIIIVHGGGWQANDEDIMRGLARELARRGRFVVFSLDYRWAGRAEDARGNSMASLIEDVFGGIAHIAEYAKQYGGDASRIGVTGDSAGGHLSAAVALMTNRIGARGFGAAPGVFEFRPSYVPAGMTLEQLRAQLTTAIRAAAPSYGVFAPTLIDPHVDGRSGDLAWKQALAPLSNIPRASERSVPQFLLRGTRDPLISDAAVKEYADALVQAGQRVEYIQVGGAGHAFLDWKPDAATRATFAQYGLYHAAAMHDFFVSTLY